MAKVHLAYNDELYTPVSGEVWIVDADGTGQVKPIPNTGGGGSGVTDHGQLTGLADDDHTQYLNTARHNAIDAADHGSGAATDGYVLTADGAGGAAWEPAQAGAAAFDDLTDVTITTPTTGDLVRYNGTTWVNYPDSNYAASSHIHDATDITTGTFADARISQSSVTQHQAALTITESQISDLAHLTLEEVQDNLGTSFIVAGTDINITYDDVANTLTINSTATGVTDHGALTGLGDDDHTQYLNTTRHDAHDHSTAMSSVVLDDISDVVETTITTGDVLRWNGTNWVNYPDSNYATSSHNHPSTDITDFTEAVQDVVGGMVTGNTETDIDVTYDDNSGKLNFVVTAAGGATSLDGLSDVTITTPVDNNLLAYDNGTSQWINQTAAEAGVSAVGHTHTESDITDLDHYTSTDFNTDFAGKSTTDLSEGTNLYYTTTRANSAIDARVDKAFVDALNVDADTLDGIDSTGFATSSHSHDADYVNITGDTMTGILTVSGGGIVTQDAGSSSIDIRDTNTNIGFNISYFDGVALFSKKDDSGGFPPVFSDIVIDGIATPTDANDATNKGYVDTNFAAISHTHTESDITDLGSYPDATGQPASKVAETDGAGGWTFIDTPSGGTSGHPHVNTVEISDGTTVQWEIDLEVDGTLSFNFVG